ncbi:MAG: Rrf2 family transcriptional regulator [Patescibacteria group bacterium]|nr:Rrf2 family transcriptional regulator [Patescibacteria group bacterium]
MRISWGEDYAVIFMSELTDNYNKKLVPLSAVSKKYQISLPFLKQLAMMLKKNNLIKSKEGITGGYQLAKDPKEITLLQVISALNNSMKLTACCGGIGAHKKNCPKEAFCKTKSTWKRINQEILDKLNSVKLSDL